MAIFDRTKDIAARILKKVKKIKSKASRERQELSERHKTTLDFSEPGFDLTTWEKFHKICDIKTDFVGVRIPIIPKIYAKNKDLKKPWRRHFLSIAREIDLKKALELTEVVSKKVLDADFEIDKRILEYAEEYHGRRHGNSYHIRYLDEAGQVNSFTDYDIKTIIEKRYPVVMSLLEALILFCYYILCHDRMTWNRLKDVVCPETYIKGASNEVSEVAVFEVNNIAFNGPNVKSEVCSLNDFKGIKLHTYAKIKISIKFVPVSKLRWNQWPRQVLV
jgi:hypothetical protein